MSQKQKTEEKEERLNDGNNNGQATHGARMAHASRLGQKIYFFCIYLLDMPKYWVTNYFTRGRFPEVGQLQKTEKKIKIKEILQGLREAQAAVTKRWP